MKRLAWLSDLHLNMATVDRIGLLTQQVRDAQPDLVLIGGDIGEAATFARLLHELSAALSIPIAFVLGNHDYYRGSIAEVRKDAQSLSRESEAVLWLPDAGVVPLTANTALVGHGGWGDGRLGNFLNSDVVLNDYLLIDQLRAAHAAPYPTPQAVLSPPLLNKLNALGDEAANHLRRVVPKALEQTHHVVVLTHVPPFREACWHEGQLSDDNWAPHFTCQAVGQVLVECMTARPDCTMTVLCGHTHSPGEAKVLDNLEVLTAAAKYGEPALQQVLNVE